MQGPDHKTSMNYLEFKSFVNDIRNTEKALGNHIKTCHKEELQMKFVSSKSVAVSRDIYKNEKLSLKDIKLLRPNIGVKSQLIKKILGLKLKKNKKKKNIYFGMMFTNREIPIYVSTSAIGSKSLSKTVRKFNQYGIKNIELSYGVFEKDFKNKFKKLSKKNNFLFHNYYPKPKKEFVINLASFNRNIRLQSIKFIKNNIDFCSKNKIKFYSFHAGFLVDPKPKHLGKKIPKIVIQPRQKSIKLFINTIKISLNMLRKKNKNFY